MKRGKWIVLAGALLIVFMTSACWFGNVTVTILQTSDVHHHASGYGPFSDYTPLLADDDMVSGGYARLAKLTNDIRQEQVKKGIPTLLFDSGDFLMGTVYDFTNTSDPIALKFIQMMKYDAITLGNHEFDWSPSGLALILSSAAANGFTVPVVATNTVIPEGNDLQGLVNAGVIVGTKVIEHPCGVKIGIIGLMGPDADSKAPAASPVTFRTVDNTWDYAFIQQQVDNLRKKQKVQVVIALSHGGVENNGTGDDADLANNVKGIDIIASGHYHTATGDALVAGDSNTIIFSPGEYGEYLSRLDVTYNIFTRKMVDYTFTLIPVNDKVGGNPQIQAMVEMYNVEISEKLNNAELPALDDQISSTDFALEMASCQVTGIGSLAADSLRATANGISLLSGGDPFDISIVASGVIRDEIYPGKTTDTLEPITFSDAYNMLPLGISPYDQSIPGYPLMSVYASGRDIYVIGEVALSLAPTMGSDYYLNFSGLKIYYESDDAASFSGVKGIYAYAPDDTFCVGPLEGFPAPTLINPYDPSKLYRIVVDLYALQMLYVVNDYLDLYDIDPIDPIDPTRLDFDGDPSTGIQEVKEWMALLNFLPGLGGSIPSEIYGTDGLAYGRVVELE